MIIVAEGKLMPTQVGEYLLFAAMIAGCDMIFILLSVFYYEYVKEGEFDSFEYPAHISHVNLEDEKDEGKVNPAMQDEKVDDL